MACRSCKRPIRWAVTTKGRRIPLDPEPVAGGNVRLTRSSDGDVAEILSGSALDAAKSRLERLFMPHHATCPEGKAWQRSGSKPRRTIERRDG